jgi:hypothetical protein
VCRDTLIGQKKIDERATDYLRRLRSQYPANPRAPPALVSSSQDEGSGISVTWPPAQELITHKPTKVIANTPYLTDFFTFGSSVKNTAGILAPSLPDARVSGRTSAEAACQV